MNKIYYIKQHSVFSTDGNLGRPWREEKHVQWLSESGYQVHWLSSSFDHYGKVKREVVPEINGVEIQLFDVLKYKKNVSLSRLLGNWMFAFKLFFTLLLNIKNIDKIICAYPTPESSLISVLIAKLTRVTLIIDMRDNWPEALVLDSKTDLVSYLFIIYCRAINSIIFALHDQYIGMSDGVLKKVKARRKNRSDGLSLALPNTISIDSPVQKIPVFLDPEKVFISFFGTLNSQFTFDILNESLSEIGDKFPNVIFLVIGSGERFEEYKRSFQNQPNIRFLGRRKYGEVLDIANQSSAFFCFYHNPEIFYSHFTNKLIEYLQFGKPFIHNLKSEFFLNNIPYLVGCSTLDISLVDFVEKLVDGVGYNNFDFAKNYDLSEFYESVVKEKFIKVIK